MPQRSLDSGAMPPVKWQLPDHSGPSPPRPAPGSSRQHSGWAEARYSYGDTFRPHLVLLRGKRASPSHSSTPSHSGVSPATSGKSCRLPHIASWRRRQTPAHTRTNRCWVANLLPFEARRSHRRADPILSRSFQTRIIFRHYRAAGVWP